MSKAIGMIEFKTTSTGVTAADAMVKTSEVEIVEAQTVCPGKYIAIITGDLSAVKAAVDTAVTTYEDKCIDSFVLGNPHESIFPAIYGTTQVEDISALGILETYDAASIIEAADQAAKTAIVDVIELRIRCLRMCRRLEDGCIRREYNPGDPRKSRRRKSTSCTVRRSRFFSGSRIVIQSYRKAVDMCICRSWSSP